MSGDWRSAKARAGLIWGLVFIVAVQVGLLASRSHWAWFAHDPEFAFKLEALRKLQAQHPARTPVVLLLGSSRTACGIQPDKFPPLHLSKSKGEAPLPAVVYNFALCRSGTFTELLCLRRLLERGLKPDVVLVEVWQSFFLTRPSDVEAETFETYRIHLRELPWFLHYHPKPEKLLVDWGKLNAPPVLGLREPVLMSIAPFALSPTDYRPKDWQGLDAHGWLYIDVFGLDPDLPHLTSFFETLRDQNVAGMRNPTVHESTERAMREFLLLCKKNQITVKIMLYPDAFQPFYPPQSRALFDDKLQTLAKQYGAGIVDLRTALRREAFVEGIHLTHAAAAAFSEKLGREVLRPILENPTASGTFVPGR